MFFAALADGNLRLPLTKVDILASYHVMLYNRVFFTLTANMVFTLKDGPDTIHVCIMSTKTDGKYDVRVKTASDTWKSVFGWEDRNSHSASQPLREYFSALIRLADHSSRGQPVWKSDISLTEIVTTHKGKGDSDVFKPIGWDELEVHCPLPSPDLRSPDKIRDIGAMISSAGASGVVTFVKQGNLVFRGKTPVGGFSATGALARRLFSDTNKARPIVKS
ncbi:hypothetical protein CF319_g875 [Tilletia indica]|nr:hypothetical protein CF319_g875 [Tilletia indica]KAE8227915.1 hypothetical protein CF326_g7171 [Tilletia indica]